MLKNFYKRILSLRSQHKWQSNQLKWKYQENHSQQKCEIEEKSIFVNDSHDACCAVRRFRNEKKKNKNKRKTAKNHAHSLYSYTYKCARSNKVPNCFTSWVTFAKYRIFFSLSSCHSLIHSVAQQLSIQLQLVLRYGSLFTWSVRT